MKKLLLPIFVFAFFIALAPVLVSLAKGPKNQSDSNGKSGECTTIQSGELLASDGSVIDTGYDQWGYNYQAHIFNGYYCDAYRDAAWCQPYKDISLIMKWNDAWLSNKDCDGDGLLDRHYGHDSYIGSGAWETNHQSGEYEIERWDLVGDYTIDFNFGSHWIHDMSILSQDDEGNLEGTGGYPSESLYSHEWIMEGIVDGTTVSITIEYLTGNPGYIVYMSGEIMEDGHMYGTCTTSIGQSCSWETSDGLANKTIETCEWNYFVKIVAVPEDAYAYEGIWYSVDGTEIGTEIWGEFAVIQQVENDPCAGISGAQYISPAGPGLGKYKP